MRNSKALKLVELICLIVFIYGSIVFVFFGFLLDIVISKDAIGIAVMLGWVAVPIAVLFFVFDTFMLLINKAPNYWLKLSPLNFSFVLLVLALFSYNKSMGIAIPIILITFSFLVSWLIIYKKIYQNKFFILIAFIIIPSFCSFFGYHVPLFVAAILLFISIFIRYRANRGYADSVA